MNKSILLTLPAALLLASCGGTSSPASGLSSQQTSASGLSVPSSEPSSSSSSYDIDKDIAWVSPKGIPTIAFYDKGANENWQTFGDATQVAPYFAGNNVDFIVFDATNGLTNIAKNNRNYKFARWISGGTFYLVSAKHASLTDYQKGQSIDAFVENGNASHAFRHLAKNKWNWGELTTDDVTYENGVAAVKTKIEANPNAYDYYVVAQPVLMALKKTVTFTLEVNLQTEWANLYENEVIPAAGLFVNNSSYASKKEACDDFIDLAVKRIGRVMIKESLAVNAMNDYGDAAKCQERFGYAPGVVSALMADDKNGFGLVDPNNQDTKAKRVKIANDFAKRIGLAEYDASLFLDNAA